MRYPWWMALFLILMLTSGCWSARDIKQLSIVSGAAIDPGKQAPYRLTIQFADPTAMVHQQERPHPYYVKQAEGYSVLDAVRNISRRDSRRRLWSHMEMLLINEKLVRRENLFRLLDVAQRYHEMRRDIVVALVSGTDAARFLERKVEPPLLGGFVLRRINQESYESGEALLTTMFDLLLVKYGEVKDMLLVEARETEGDVSFNGAAVLKDGRKVGRVDFPEIRGYLLIKNLLKSGTDIIRTKRGSVTVWLEGGKIKTKVTSLRPLTFTIKGMVKGHIQEINSSEDFSRISSLRRLERRVAREVTGEIRRSLRTSQRFRADYCQLGNLLAQYHPSYWKKVKEHWSDRIWPQAKFRIEIHVRLLHSGRENPKGR